MVWKEPSFWRKDPKLWI